MPDTTKEIDNYNNTNREFVYKKIHLLIEEQTAKTPDNTAIRLLPSNTEISYRALNEAANQMANFLHTKIPKLNEKVIAVCTNMSLSWPLLSLAIWKTGGIVMFIDPKTPKDLFYEQLRISKAVFLIADSSIKTTFHNVIYLDLEGEALQKQGSENLINTDMNVPNPACLFFTSGSTGQPKGVLNGHIQLLNYILDLKQRFSITKTSKFLLSQKCTFDPVIAEFCTPLICGAECIVINFDNMPEYAAAINTYNIDVIFSTPAGLDLLIDAGFNPIHPLSILCGGEAPTMQLISKLAKLSQISCYNVYGTTESTIYSTIAKMDSQSTTIIGRPIANTQLYVLNEKFECVEPGQKGEIYIGGLGLADGYFDAADITAQKFLYIDLNGVKNRLYKTGDYALWTGSEIIYLGRQDNQIKILGQRMDTGQIEEYICIYPQIAKCSVILYQDLQYSALKYLVAFLIVKPGEVLNHAMLSKHLCRYLPVTSLPELIFLEAFPLTVSGKIDKKCLEAMYIDKLKSSLERVKSIRDSLSILWNRIIGLQETDTIVREQTFFSQGGDSFKLNKLVNEINRIFNIKISITDIYQNPSIDTLEQKIYQLQRVVSALPIGPEDKTESKGDLFPLSLSQLDIWKASQIYPRAYNETIVIKFNVEPNIESLHAALRTLVERHKILLTVLKNDHLLTEPQQVILSFSNVDMTKLMQIRDDAKQSEESAFRQILLDEAEKPFDEENLAFRTLLFSRPNNTYIFLFCASHRIIDGYSEIIIINELLTLYDAYKYGYTNTLPPLSMGYADFVSWQRKLFTDPIDPSVTLQLAFWKRELAKFPSVDITENSVSGQTEDPGNQIFFTIPKDIRVKCEHLAQQQNCTLYNVVLTAFFALLWRYTGQSDLAVGTAHAGRHCPFTENLVGHFVNILPLKCTIAEDATVYDLLKAVSSKVQLVLDNSLIPYQQLTEIIRANGSQPPEIMFVFMPRNNLARFSNIEVDPFYIESRYAKYPLTFYVFDKGDELLAVLEYSSCRFTPKMMQTLTEHYKNILSGLCGDIRQNIAKIPILSLQEMKNLQQWGMGSTLEPPQETIPVLFTKVVDAFPQKKALQTKNGYMTYAELNQAKEKITYFLNLNGIVPMPRGAEKIVAIFMHPHSDNYIAILGILFAGAAYLPLDLKTPEKRLRDILRDSKVSVILTQIELKKTLEYLLDNDKSIIISTVDEILSLIGEKQESPPQYKISPNTLAYRIYTSGSTGTPKGVDIEHKGVVALASWGKNLFGMHDERILAWSDLSFDASVFNWAIALLNSSILCIPYQEKAVGEELTAMIKKFRITIIVLPPSVLSITNPPDNKDLRIAVSAGEPCTQVIVNKWPNLEFYNAYGPTEATVCTTIDICSISSDNMAKLSIGKPLPGFRIYILDKNNQLLPDELPGELGIESEISLARGYTDAKLTSNSFVTILDPFDISRSVRIYKTGDRVKWENGILRFLGRVKDNKQIKIRGLRVELSDIEHCLMQLPFIKHAIVVLQKGSTSLNDYLSAFIVVEASTTESTAAINVHLKKNLPPYMIPTNITVIDKIPMTTHGKIDYQYLKTLEISEKTATRLLFFRNPPVTATEKIVADIWAKVLNYDVQNISRDDNFFALGGNSITIASVLTLLKEAIKTQKNFVIKTTVLQIYRAQNLRELAEIVDQQLFPQTKNCKKTMEDGVTSGCIR